MTTMRRFISVVTCLCLSVLIFSSCRKDNITTNPSDKLAFSTDTLTFDTVFTTLGSTTLYFTVHNPNSQKISISNIHLSGGENSIFRLNIDGQAINQAANVEIPANEIGRAHV